MPARSSDPSKPDLRAAALARRDALTDAHRVAAATAIARRGLPLAINPGMIVAGYAAIRSEIDPLPLMRELLAQGAMLALPVILARDAPLSFRIYAPDAPLTAGPYGIPQPLPDAAEIFPDVVLLPLAAFDRSGHRIGYGAGFYDRTLVQLRAVNKTTAIGVAYAAQQVPEIVALPHDVAMDYVLTEDETIDFRSQ